MPGCRPVAAQVALWLNGHLPQVLEGGLLSGWPGTGSGRLSGCPRARPGPGSALQVLGASRQVSPGAQASPAQPRPPSEVPLHPGARAFPAAAFPEGGRLLQTCRGLHAAAAAPGLELLGPRPDGVPQPSTAGARELCLTPEPPSHFCRSKALLPVPRHSLAVPAPHCSLCWDQGARVTQIAPTRLPLGPANG